MRKRFIRPPILALIFAGVAVLYSACGGGGPQTVSQPITAANGGDISLGNDITVRVPAGALDGDATVTVTSASEQTPTPSAELENGKRAGQAFNIDVAGRKLAKPITLEIAFDPGELPEGTPEQALFLAFYDEGAKKWVPVGGQVDDKRNVVTIETDHLSWWEPWTWVLDALKAALYAVLTADPWQIYDTATNYAGCTSSSAVLIEPAKANSILDACFESADADHPKLRIINRKVFTVQLDPVGQNSSRAGFASALEGPRGIHSFQTDFSGLYSGDSIEVSGGFSRLAFGVDIVLWAMRIIPGGHFIPFDEAIQIANEIGKDPIIQPALDLWEHGDYLKAVQKVGEVFNTPEFARLLVKYLTGIPIDFAKELLKIVDLLLIPAAGIAVAELVSTARSPQGLSGTMAFVSNKPRPTLTAAPTIPAVDNLVPNPSFESGGRVFPDSWIYGTFPGSIATLERDSDVSHSGTWSVSISEVIKSGSDCAFTGAAIWQTAALIPIDLAKTYRFSAWVRWRASVEGVRVTPLVGAYPEGGPGDGINGADLPADTWHLLSGTYGPGGEFPWDPAAQPAVRIWLYMGGWGYSGSACPIGADLAVWFDDVCLREIN